MRNSAKNLNFSSFIQKIGKNSNNLFENQKIIGKLIFSDGFSEVLKHDLFLLNNCLYIFFNLIIVNFYSAFLFLYDIRNKEIKI